MKISDFIHLQSLKQKPISLIYRVRVFNDKNNNIFALITDLQEKCMGGSITNSIESIYYELINKGHIPKTARIIEHYEYDSYRSSTFNLVEISEDSSTKWVSISEDEIYIFLDCSKAEFSTESLAIPRIYEQVQFMRHSFDPFIDVPFSESNEILIRKDEIRKHMVSKSILKEAIEASSIETKMHELIKSDLSILGDYFSGNTGEYICFSECPLNDNEKDRSVDFVVLTDRSRMDVILIEIKGADYNLINKNHYSNFSAKTNEAVQQLRERTSCIYRNYDYFRRYFHELREKAEKGDNIYNAFVGPAGKLQVDPNKEIHVRRVCIGGKSLNDIKESRLRHEYEIGQSPPILIESWDSFVNKLRRP